LNRQEEQKPFPEVSHLFSLKIADDVVNIDRKIIGLSIDVVNISLMSVWSSS